MSCLSKRLCFVFCLFLLNAAGFGQSPSTTPNIPMPRANTRTLSPEQAEYVRMRSQQKWEDQQQSAMRRMEQESNLSLNLPRNKPNGKPYTKEELKKIKLQLEPDPQNLITYKEFLRQPKTGIIRLFPDFNCESSNVIRTDADCENFIPGSWSYSFRTKNRAWLDYSDIRFYGTDLISDGFLSQGIIVPLGDVPLDDVSFQTNGMKFLNDFKPEPQSIEAKKQFAQIAKVFDFEGYQYSKRVRAVENMTYAMRLIAYRNEKSVSFIYDEKISASDLRFLRLNEMDKRTDLTVCFRVISTDKNKSIEILWKELKRQDAPKLIFRKKDKLTDLNENE